VEHYKEVGIADAVAALQSSPNAPQGRCLSFKYKTFAYINMASCSTWR